MLGRTRSSFELGKDDEIHDSVNQSRNKNYDGYDRHYGIAGFFWSGIVWSGCIGFVGWHIVYFVF